VLYANQYRPLTPTSSSCLRHPLSQVQTASMTVCAPFPSRLASSPFSLLPSPSSLLPPLPLLLHPGMTPRRIPKPTPERRPILPHITPLTSTPPLRIPLFPFVLRPILIPLLVLIRQTDRASVRSNEYGRLPRSPSEDHLPGHGHRSPRRRRPQYASTLLRTLLLKESDELG